MSSTRHHTLTTTHSDQAAFSALVYAVQQGKYEIVGLSNEIKEVIFVSQRTPMAYERIFMMSVVEQGNGSVVQGTVQMVEGVPRALLDGRKNQKMIERLLADVEAILADPAKPQPEPVESFQITDDGSVVPWTERDLSGH